MKHTLNGQEVSPENRFDIGISVDFQAKVDQQKMTTDTIILSREGNQIVKDHLKNKGILEGIKYSVEFGTNSKIDYIVDLTDNMEVYDNKVHVNLKGYLGHDQFFDKAESLIFNLVDDAKLLTAIEINYQVLPQDANGRALTASLALFTLGITIGKQTEEVSERASELSLAYIPIVGIGIPPAVIVDYNAIALAGIRLALSIIFTAILIYEAIVLGTEIFRLLSPPLLKLQACTALNLLQGGCKFLGYDFKSSILEGDYSKMVILPIPQNMQPNRWYEVFESDYGTGKNKHFPQAGDTTGTLGALIVAMENMFNARCRVLDGVVQLERWDYWKAVAQQSISSSLVIQADRVNKYEYDLSKLFKRYYIHYMSDYSDLNTLDVFENNLAEYSLEANGIKDVKLNLIKGLEEKIVPFALAKRKDKMTWLEKQFKGLYKAIDYLTNGNTNLVAKSNKMGAIQVTSPFFSTTKMFMWDGAKGMSTNQSKMHPTYLWDNFHYINQPDLYQYIVKKNVKIHLSKDKFIKIYTQNYVKIDGKLCEIMKIDYFDEKNYGVIDYREPSKIFPNYQFTLNKIY